MKPIPTKAELRSRLAEEMAEFLDRGGEVNEVPRGISGRDSSQEPQTRERPDAGAIGSSLPAQREDRTYLTEVVAAIEARRRPQSGKSTPSRKRPRKRLIYDDFGEPLRWEWVDE